jgi:LDH2 family malate/lactate/ureidoglycolate dehydrogenase
MMPLGGYKGSGLGLMAEILCAGLSGGPMSLNVGSLRKGRMPLGISHMFLAIDPNRFAGLPAFNGRVDSLMETVKSSAPAKGYDEVLVAGEPEQRTEQLRLREGIPIPLTLWQKLTERAKPQGA